MGERYNVDLQKKKFVGADSAHIARYIVARGLIRPGDHVLDAACGTGYGSRFLKQVATKVWGFDYSDEALKHAELRHTLGDGIEFNKADFNTHVDYPEVDVSVSLETVEHLKEPEHLKVMLVVCL